MSRLKITYNVGGVIDKKLEVSCLVCRRTTKHVILTLVAENGETSSSNFDFWYVKNHQIIQCLGCESICFRIEDLNSEDLDYDQEQGTAIPYVSETLFPSRSAGRSTLKDILLLPVNIQRVYAETVNAMNNSLPVLAGIGIRSVVEAVWRDKNEAGKDLYEWINALDTLGYLTPDGAKILQQIRALGNEAAHEVKPHKAEHLLLAMDVYEHFLQGVYLLPQCVQETFN